MEHKNKPRVKGFMFPVFPDKQQAKLFNETFGCCRFVWNKALAEAIKEYDDYLAKKELGTATPEDRPDVSGYGFVQRLVRYKADKEYAWLNDVSSVALQQTMLHLGMAFSRFFKTKTGYPKFKSKYARQSLSLMNNSFRFKDGELYIAKSKDPLKIKFTRELPSAPSSATISKTPTGELFISFTCEYFPEKTSGTDIIGIDVGINDFITTSDGWKVSNPKHFEKSKRKLKRRQQSLSRKQKGSRNQHKARIVVAKCHKRIANLRSDFRHKLSRFLVNKSQVIGVERLRVRNMLKNRLLSRFIADAAWSLFLAMLEYKVRESQHCNLVYMDPFFPSSKLCNVTRNKLNRPLKLSERSWECPFCGQTHDRDINAALNIRDEAMRTIARGYQEMPSGQIINSITR